MKKILFIDDNEEIIEGVKSVLQDIKREKKIEFECEFARCMVEASTMLDNSIKIKVPYDGIIIDMMLPKNEENRIDLQSYYKKRGSLLLRLIKKTNYSHEKLDDETVRLRREIDEIDDSIHNLIELEGGYKILELYFNSLRIEKLSNPAVIVVTGRSFSGIEEKCRTLVKPGHFEWLEKPQSLIEVFNKLLFK
jgi:CheY-like chemotaxis protein